LKRIRARDASVAVLAFVLAACGSKSHTGASFASTVAPTSLPATVPALAAPGTFPVILVHGHGGGPADFGPLLDHLAAGRARRDALYAAEADQLKPGDLPEACVVSAGYYRDSISGPLYDPDPSGNGTDAMGGCPTQRSDGNAGRYPNSYVARLARIVDGVRRASGSDRVDLIGHSMGCLIGRAYARWLSDGAAGGKSKVRRILCLAGPHRGINALEALVDGLDNGIGPRAFMLMGEDAEMCYPYQGWQGFSYIDRLNNGWDAFCTQEDVRYGGVTSTGAFGPQVAPPAPPAPPAPVVISGQSPGSLLGSVLAALGQLVPQTIPDALPFISILLPNAIPEVDEALGPSDGTVRVESSRMDRAPFGQASVFAFFEARHSGDWNPEQAVHVSSFTAELARQFLELPALPAQGLLTSAAARLVDAPGRASWIAVETAVTGGPLATAQLIEEKLDANGNVIGGATGYGFPVPAGDQRVFVPVAAGGGDRTYHLVVYGPGGPVATKDLAFHLTDGALDVAPATSFATATTTRLAQGPVVHATFASNVPSSEPSLGFAFRIDGGDWSAWAPSASVDTPPLGPGEHRVEARSRHAKNGASLLAEDPRGVVVGIAVDANGSLTLRP
jgi:pimeloyl-ACP methyl ester carboxylesterase